MYRRLLLRLLFTPSVSSAVVAIGTALGVLGYSSWLYIHDNQILYNQLFGTYGFSTGLWRSSLGLTAWYATFLNSSLLYYLIISVASLLIGLAIFTILQGLSLFLRGTASLWQEVHVAKRNHQAILNNLVMRLGLRALSVAGWGTYLALYFVSIAPFAIVLTQAGINSWVIGPWQGAALCLGALLLLTVATHLHITFLRLCLLRVRLWHPGHVVRTR